MTGSEQDTIIRAVLYGKVHENIEINKKTIKQNIFINRAKHNSY